jgi:hypothetical protein
MKFQHLLLLLILIFSCGRESKIKNAVKSKSTALAYGDGTNTVLPIVIPLGNKELGEFDSGLGKIGFFAGGFAKMFFNMGANLGLGRVRISLTQRIPEFPSEYISSLKVKRIFFYIEPTFDSHRKVPWYLRFFNGRSDVDFRFVDKFGLKVSTREIENRESWEPIIETVSLDKIEIAPLLKIFAPENLNSPIEVTEFGKELTVIRYDKKEAEKYLKDSDLHKMFILKSSKPTALRKFLMTHPLIRKMIKATHIMSDSIFVELVHGKNEAMSFQELINKESDTLKLLGLELLEPCYLETCFDFKVSNENLLPLLDNTNGLQLDAYIDAKKYPDSFKLKGFIEFELKLKLDF